MHFIQIISSLLLANFLINQNEHCSGGKIMYIFETVFDIAYLIFVVTLGIIMIFKANGNKQYQLFGWMSVILGVGDSFHLIPRVYSMWSAGGFEANAAALGIGQFITSITMTVFYVVLYAVWRERYNIKKQNALTITIIALAIIRIALCFAPQNAWMSVDAPLAWGIYRNIPFAIIGIIMIVLFYKQASKNNDKAFRFMWLAITLSFAFYAPVVLFSKVFPPIGALMLPKTVAYVFIVCMGYNEMKSKVRV